MELGAPRYYRDFRCLAGACPDSCCHQWAVQVDAASAARYRSLPGELGQRLRQFLREEEGETILSLEDGRCPMWRTDGLCRIQVEQGEDALCQTCREFPRLRHDYGDFVELGLELSCPEAARLILTGDDSWEVRQLPGGEPPEYDREAMALLLESRDVARKILEEDRPVPQSLALLLLYGASVQGALDGGEPVEFSPADALETAAMLAQPGDMQGILALFRNLEILTPRWEIRLSHPAPARWEQGHLAFARYLVMRYWLQAVADYDLYGRVKFIVTACLLVKHLGGELVETAQIFSKEIENDAENVDALLDAAYESPALTDRILLGLLAQ